MSTNIVFRECVSTICRPKGIRILTLENLECKIDRLRKRIQAQLKYVLI